MRRLDDRADFRPSYARELTDHGHLKFPKGVDGDAVISAITDGVSQEDISAGNVDPTTLTRAQQASIAIDGFVPSVTEAAIKWTPIDVDEQSLAKLVGLGGGILTFRQDNSLLTQAFTDVIESLDAPRAALLWDDSVPAVRAFQLDVSVLHGAQSLILDAGPIRGQRLTLWIESSILSFSVVAVSPEGTAQQAAQIEKEATSTHLPSLPGLPDTGIGSALSGIGNTINGAIGRFFDVQLEVGLALVVVAGIALFLWLEDHGPEFRHE